MKLHYIFSGSCCAFSTKIVFRHLLFLLKVSIVILFLKAENTFSQNNDDDDITKTTLRTSAKAKKTKNSSTKKINQQILSLLRINQAYALLRHPYL